MNETSEGTLEVCCIWAIFFRFITLSDIWDGRTRETGAEWSVLKGCVLGGGSGEIYPLVDWETGRHLDGEEGIRRWRKERKKILEISVLPTASRDEKQSRRSFGFCHPRLISRRNPIFIRLSSSSQSMSVKSSRRARLCPETAAQAALDYILLVTTDITDIPTSAGRRGSQSAL